MDSCQFTKEGLVPYGQTPGSLGVKKDEFLQFQFQLQFQSFAFLLNAEIS